MISGTKFWEYNTSLNPHVKSTYPKPISILKGIPDNIDAAVQYSKEYTYIFKGRKYYRFKSSKYSVSIVILMYNINFKLAGD